MSDALDFPCLAISLSGLNGLAGLLDLLEDCLVGELVGGNDFGRLGLERHVERFDACRGGQ